LKPDCVTLWIGDSLGALERACIRSVLRQGHRLALYCYREPAGTPEGVGLRDAAEILPEQSAFRHRSGSAGPFSDWFRYELQRRGLGTWIDTDVYLLAPLDGLHPHLFGEQEPGLINNAVLRLPADSPLLSDLLGPFEQRTTPKWLPWSSYLRSRARELVKGSADPSRLPWGSTGPHALTAAARKHGVSSEAMPTEVFYPVPWQQADWLLDPSLTLDDMVTERTVAVHLWNECIRRLKDPPAPAGSFLRRLQDEGRA
jgi:hypothetical protein